MSGMHASRHEADQTAAFCLTRREVVASVFATLVSAALAPGLVSCSGSNEVEDVARLIGMELPASAAIRDSAGSLSLESGDGSGFRYLCLSFSQADAKALARQVADDGRWQALPLPEGVELAAFGTSEDLPVAPASFEPLMPHIESGWYLLDTQADSNASFTLAVLDAETLRLHILDLRA